MPDFDDTQFLPPLDGAEEPSTSDLGAPPRRPRSDRPRFRLLLALLGGVIVLAAGLFALHVRSHGLAGALQPFLPKPDLARVFGKPNLRVLVMGLDENWSDKDEGFTAGARTDTLLAVNVDLTSKQVNIVSIPRDLWVYIPKSGYGKVNEAFSDGGPLRTEATVIKNLATPPFDYYMVLKIDATKNIVDALGGLDVNVEKSMDYDDTWGHLHIHLKAGPAHLSGEQTVGYIRFRHDEEGDFGRMRRQRQVVQLLARRLRDPSIALHLPSLLGIVKDNVRMDMPFGKLYDLALGLRDVTPQMVHSLQLPADEGWIAGESVLFARDTARSVVAKYLVAGFGSAFDPSTVHVRIENGSGTPGAASAIALFLRQRGFDVVQTGNAKTFDNSTTTIKGHDQHVMGEVAKRLPIKNPKIAVGRVDGVDVDIVVGRDYRVQ